ncbi:MAG: YgjV family protein [Oscillospiraceae bacterium]|nr:YgjV family protein [Oscillospiraceae bacterium]
MNHIILGNIIALVGSLIMASLGLIKDEKKLLTVQNIQFAVFTVGNLVLGGITGAIANFVSMLRNILCIKINFGLGWKLFFIALQSVLSLVFNNAGLLGLLPVFAACIFTLCMGFSNELLLKSAIVLGQLAWAVYDFNIMNYTTLVFDILAVCSSMYAIIMILTGHRTAKQEKA